ncbi:MAG: ADP-ribosylglycohydrolase family protein [Clostridiales bacterium]|nr:ADP-ribosylglycohydrolase family protein [Clostridiales bacterium]
MIYLSKEELRDRIYACWIGKNIGGTLGTPYEGTRELLDIEGFASAAGEPLPNDDLDLQLVWLRAVNDLGPDAINSKVLGEYWTSFINPNWNEYGVCKANMRQGILPPMSGEYNNTLWRNSNGAWIRTEVWACLYPACPEKAIRLSYEDASVDHGFGEGTYAAIFVAAVESAAFVVKDFNQLLDIGLSKIPDDCRVARAINLVRKAHAEGIDWKTCREMIVKDSEDLGWFQAPANVAYVVLGLLYGECDFKKSMILAINCGDDTDCTGATLGSILGIKDGMAGIPKDWMAYIGEGIKSICLTNGHGAYPQDCTTLTDCILSLLPVTLRETNNQIMMKKYMPHRYNGKGVQLAEKTDLSEMNVKDFYGNEFALSLAARKHYSYTIEGIYASVLVEFDEKPQIAPGGTLTGMITVRNNNFFPEQKQYSLRYLCPEGWQVEGARSTYCSYQYLDREAKYNYNQVPFTIHAGEQVAAVNNIILEVTSPGRPNPILVPIQVMG